MSDYSNWFVGIATFFLGLVAILQERIKAHWFHPTLDCTIEMSPPDCHKTVMTGPTLSFHTYYFLFKIWNRGNNSARDVEVIISDLFKKEYNDYVPIKEALPDNLNWSLLSEWIYIGDREVLRSM